MSWPGQDEPTPIYHRVQPARRPVRSRHPSEAQIPHLAPNGQVIMDQNGQLLMPVGAYAGRPQRSSSVSGRPATIIIENTNVNRLDEDGRPISAHGHYIGYGGQLMDRRPSNRSRRSGSVHRLRTPSPYEAVLEYDEYGRVKSYPAEYSPRYPGSPGVAWRSKEDEEKLRELEEKERELKALKEAEKEKERKKKLEEELQLQALEKEKKRRLREEEDKKLKAAAIEEWKEKEAKEKAKKQKEKEEEEAKFIELLRTEGYTEAEARKRLRRMEKMKEKGVTADDYEERRPNALVKSKPTYIKVQSKHISPATLDLFEMPWEWDSRDAGYIIIKRWVGEHEQEILFNHTKQMRDQARITYPRQSLKDDATRLVVAAKEKPRKKSPIKRTSWFLT